MNVDQISFIFKHKTGYFGPLSLNDCTIKSKEKHWNDNIYFENIRMPQFREKYSCELL